MTAFSSLARYGRTVSLLAPWIIFVGCSEARDTEDHVPSRPGATQPKTSGTLLTEAEACQKLVAAELSARTRLSCIDPARKCPEYIRPAGASSCFKYDSGSIDGCIEAFNANRSCPEFDEHPCLVTAVLDPTCAGVGGAPGLGGAAGSGGAGGDAAGAAGAAGVAGEAGLAGASGEAGAGGLGGTAGVGGS